MNCYFCAAPPEMGSLCHECRSYISWSGGEKRNAKEGRLSRWARWLVLAFYASWGVIPLVLLLIRWIG